MNVERIGAALGKIPSGVFIATSTQDGEEIGMLASFVEQAGFNPPTITVAIGLDRRLNQAVEESNMITSKTIDHPLILSNSKITNMNCRNSVMHWRSSHARLLEK